MTFKSISTSGTASSKASSLFDLDERGTKSILVYKYRSGANGLEVKTERGLCEELDHGTSPARLSIHPFTNTAPLQTPHYPSSASPGSLYLAETVGSTSSVKT